MAKRAKSKSRSFYIEALKSRGAKGRLSKMKKAELEKLYHKTMPGTEHGEDHDGPKTDHDGQQGDGYGLSLAPDPRAQQGAGHCGPDINRMRSKHKITTFVPDILLLEHWNRRFESFPTMYRSGGCP